MSNKYGFMTFMWNLQMLKYFRTDSNWCFIPKLSITSTDPNFVPVTNSHENSAIQNNLNTRYFIDFDH